MRDLYALTMEPAEIDESEFSETELEIIDKLEEGRATPGYLAEELDKTPEYISNRLRDLRRLGIVEKVHRGLYELSDLEDAE